MTVDSEKLNILITGSREYRRLEFVTQVLFAFCTSPTRTRNIDDLFVGDARGVDSKAAKVWREITGKKARIFEARWNVHGKAAGPIRNGEMIESWISAGGGIALAFWDGKSRGTLDCMKQIAKRGRSVFIPEDFQDINKAATQADLRLRIWQGEERLNYGG